MAQYPPPSRSFAPDELLQAEREFVLQAFERLKQRGNAELRVATRRNRETGWEEIVYVGVHEKEDLEPLRELYKRVRLKDVRNDNGVLVLNEPRPRATER